MQTPVEQATQCCVPLKRRMLWRSLLSLQAVISTCDIMHVPAKRSVLYLTAKVSGPLAWSPLNFPFSVHRMQRSLRFRMCCHKLPRDIGGWPCMPKLNRFCTTCQQGVSGDQKHIVFECPALQGLRDRYEILVQAPQGDAKILFMWQDDSIGVAPVNEAC